MNLVKLHQIRRKGLGQILYDDSMPKFLTGENAKTVKYNQGEHEALQKRYDLTLSMLEDRCKELDQWETNYLEKMFSFYHDIGSLEWLILLDVYNKAKPLCPIIENILFPLLEKSDHIQKIWFGNKFVMQFREDKLQIDSLKFELSTHQETIEDTNQ
jgi:hypothetical protein